MRTTKLLMLVCTVGAMALLSGCSTVAGKSRPDPVKLSQAKAIIETVAAGAIRRVILNSPEHAPEIARYAASVAGVFCTMSVSNEFAPEFLLAQLDQFTDPKLATIGDGYLIDVKNAGVGIYKLLWGDRFRAEIPSTNWLHAVCELFCDSISQGLRDAGYPGGVKALKSAGNYELRITIYDFGGASFRTVRERIVSRDVPVHGHQTRPPHSDRALIAATPPLNFRFAILDFRFREGMT